jgi:hypothetical protein
MKNKEHKITAPSDERRKEIETAILVAPLR